MEALPVEVCQYILQFADIDSIKAIRLTSKAWAILGQEYLISPHFLSLPHRDDFRRLLCISQHTAFSPLIKSVQFNQGSLNEYHARHNIYFVQYMKDPDDRDRDSRDTLEQYELIKKNRELFSSNAYDLDSLITTFKSLSHLAQLHVSLTACPFTIPLLHRIWRISSSRLLPRVTTTSHFTILLQAISLSNVRLTSLSHDRLPFEFWGNPRIVAQVGSAFSSLTDLRICSDYSVFPNALHHVDSFAGLASCLVQAPELRVLDLSFQGAVRPTVDFERYFGTITFSHLHTFALAGMVIDAENTALFLTRHKNTLRKLRIGDENSVEHTVQFRVGTLRSLLERVKDECRIEELECRGQIVEASGGEVERVWRLGRWSFELGRYIGWDEEGDEVAGRLARFVIGNGQWPDEEDNTIEVEVEVEVEAVEEGE